MPRRVRSASFCRRFCHAAASRGAGIWCTLKWFINRSVMKCEVGCGLNGLLVSTSSAIHAHRHDGVEHQPGLFLQGHLGQ